MNVWHWLFMILLALCIVAFPHVVAYIRSRRKLLRGSRHGYSLKTETALNVDGTQPSVTVQH